MDKNTPTKEETTQVLAFFTFSSCQPDNKYIIPLTIRVITAITAIYCIISDIKPHQTFHTISLAALESHGNPCQFNHKGSEAAFAIKIFVINNKTIIYIFIFLI